MNLAENTGQPIIIRFGSFIPLRRRFTVKRTCFPDAEKVHKIAAFRKGGYFFEQADNIRNNPPLALLCGIGVVAMALIPALLGLESGRYLIGKGKEKLLRGSYLRLGILILIIVYLSREATFNVAVIWADYQSGITFSFFENPFFIF